jgi:cobalamin biosynthesis protein CobT
MIPAKLRYEVRRMFENTGTEDFARGRRTGALNIAALPTMSFNDRLFKRRHEVAGVDSAVVIVIDVSGSMFGHSDTPVQKYNILHAVHTAAALLDTLHHAGVATAVITFASDVSMLKPFDMHYRKAFPLLEALKSGGGTNDCEALQQAHRMLYGRPEARKVAFVLTDGCGDGDATHDQALSGARLGVTTIGVGIKHDVSHVYPTSVTVNSLADLGGVAFNKLKLAA